MNVFKRLDAPCLVCGRIPPPPYHGITPRKAVCDECWISRHNEALEALGERLVVKEVGLIDEDQLSEMSVAEILEAIERGRLNVGYALEAEQHGKNRITLLRQLEAML